VSRRGLILPALLTLALGVTALGWWRAESDSYVLDGARFEACRWEESTLVLQWTHGLGQVVSPHVDVRSADHVVVGLELRQEPGSYPAIGLPGTLRLAVYGGPMPVSYPDGTALECATSD
jgi:hypothetical protein